MKSISCFKLRNRIRHDIFYIISKYAFICKLMYVYTQINVTKDVQYILNGTISSYFFILYPINFFHFLMIIFYMNFYILLN